MKKKLIIGISILIVLLLGTGFAVYKTIFSQVPPPPVVEEVVEILPDVDASVIVTAKNSATKDNTVVLGISGMAAKMNTVEYDFSYETKGLVKGVNSGSKPIDVAGKDAFEREIYLGTCSRNVCTPDAGVTAVTVDLKFTDTRGKMSVFSKDFEL